MQKQRARNLDERLDDMQEAITEQLMIIKALATSQALAVEQQGQTFLAQMNTDSLLRKVNLNVVTVVKTTDSILGISKRTEALVTAARTRDYWTFAGLFLDPWCCLYAYILLHPVAPISTERIISAWQFILFAYRLASIVEDIIRSAMIATSLGGVVTLYFTSPYKALYYLYWLNRAFVYGEIQASRGLIFDITLPVPACSKELSAKSFVCVADFTVTCTGLALYSLKTAIMNSDVALELSTLFSLEWAIWYSILKFIYDCIAGALYSMLPPRLKYFF
jgi:hypothetical protein